MIKKISILFLIIAASCKEDNTIASENNYTINIIGSNIEDNTKLYLRKQEGFLTINLDSTTIKAQKVTFSGVIKSPEVYGIFIEGYKEGIFPIVEQGTINIKLDINDLSTTKISGTELNDQLVAYKKKSREISDKMNDLFHEFQKARAENNSKKLTEINAQMQAINNQKNSFSINYIEKNTNSFVASMVLHSLLINSDIPKEKIASLYDKLSAEVKKSQFSKDILYELQLDSIKKDSLN